MRRKVLPELPEFPQEQAGPWPLLLPTAAERAYRPFPETIEERQLRIQHSSNDLLAQDIVASAVKGTLLGVLFFLLFFGIPSMSGFWLSSWHWAWFVGGAVVLSLLIGTGRALLIIAFGLTCLSIQSMAVHWVYLLLLIGSSVLLRCGVELLPVNKEIGISNSSVERP